MNDSLRRACALALLLLALAAAAPPLIAPDTDGLPAFDDTDASDGAAPPVFFRAAAAALPSPAPPLDAPRPHRTPPGALGVQFPDDTAPTRLTSRGPPRS